MSRSPERRATSGGASNVAGGGVNLQPRRNVPGGEVPDLQVQAIVSPERRATSGGASNVAGGGVNLQPRRNVPGGEVPDLQVQAIV
ncbi:hypothetical protein GOBAR_DD32337 [Gossypium barbadense]|nr:hypothetical protein GOBAR_DD32337 [Gossypium barbadense]